MLSYNFTSAKKVNIAIAVTLLYVPLMSYIDGQFGQGIIYHITQLIYLISFTLAFPSAIKCVSRKIFLFVSIFLFLFLLSYMKGTDSNVFQLVLKNIFLWCIPYFILSFSVRDYKDILEKLKYVSLCMLIIGYLRTFTLTFSTDSYSQDLGYDVLLPFIVYFLCFIQEKRIWYLIPVIVSLALILMSGSRGPLLCAILGVVFAYVIVKGIGVKDIVSFCFICIIYVVYNLYRVEILTWILHIFNSLNVSVRSVEMLLYNDIGDDQARNKLRQIAFNYILEHPLWGTGFINDRVYIFSHYVMNRTANVYGSYCHNFFLEILMQFGLLPGIVLIIMFLRKMRLLFINSSSILEKEYFIIVFTIGFFPLFVSRSWITFHVFYMVLGLLLVSKEKKVWRQ